MHFIYTEIHIGSKVSGKSKHARNSRNDEYTEIEMKKRKRSRNHTYIDDVESKDSLESPSQYRHRTIRR